MVCVLVVDDDIAACLILQRMVQLLGCECDIAHDGEEAVRAASSKKYSAILLDSFMPDQNGWDTALEIRSLKKGNDRPMMIGMVSLNSASFRNEWRTVGMEDQLLSKPVNRSDLHKTICSAQEQMNPHEQTIL